MNFRTLLQENVTSAEELREPLHLSQEEYEAIREEITQFPMSVTKYYLSLINPDDPDDKGDGGGGTGGGTVETRGNSPKTGDELAPLGPFALAAAGAAALAAGYSARRLLNEREVRSAQEGEEV